tara:strand:- start:11 stop:283 length:273 start_codon:yes stop_codon:yes gene_type:complete
MPEKKQKLPTLEIYGTASKKMLRKVTLTEVSKKENLMLFIKSQGLPLASSCDGDGVCHLCIVNETMVSCQMTVEELPAKSQIRKVTIGYL